MPSLAIFAPLLLALAGPPVSRPAAADGVIAGSVDRAELPEAEIIVRAWRPGLRNEALSLDGRAGSLMTELTDLSGSELTIEFWFKGSSIQSAVRQQSGFLEDFTEEWTGRSPSSGAAEQRGWVVAGWNGLHILSNDGLLNGIYYDTAAIDGRWHHVAMTWRQNSTNGFRSYLDGRLTAQRDSRNTPIGNYRQKVYLGAWNGYGERAQGLLDEVIIWKRALTGEEIAANWNRKRTGAEEGVLGCWNFDHGLPLDVSSHGGGGTLLGTAAIVPAENPELGGTLRETRLTGLGTWRFAGLEPGALYRVEAFSDLNRSGRWDPGEPRSEKDIAAGSASVPVLRLGVPQPFSRSLWVTVALALGGIVGIGAIIRLVERRRLNRRLEQLQREHQVEVERSRIARDIHDELGGKLARISYLSEALKRSATPQSAEALDALARSSRDVLRTLDTIVWAISPKYDSLENLAAYIGEYAREFFQMTAIECRIDIPEELPKVELTAPVRHNLFRAVQENLNNILKHSQASRVTLSFAMRGPRLVISIADDGRGFRILSTPPGGAAAVRQGNGLEIMRQRLSSIGGELAIQSAEARGTRVQLAWTPSAGPFARN